ncbi:MAG: hypothetical protein AB7W16_17255 [Candidatus Obscuribacterales bacterium]
MLAEKLLWSAVLLAAILLFPTPAESRQKLPVSSEIIQAKRPDGKAIKIALWYPKEALRKPCPVLIFSHGYSGGGLGQSALTSDLAAHGWIVAAPDHSDDVMAVRIGGKANGDLLKAINHLKNEKPFDPVTYSYRKVELETALEAVLHYDKLKKNPGEIAFAGHSMGGWTAMVASLKDDRVKERSQDQSSGRLRSALLQERSRAQLSGRDSRGQSLRLQR